MKMTLKTNRRGLWFSLVAVLLALTLAAPLLADTAAESTAEGVKSESLILSPGGKIEKFRYFALTSPPRLVIDIYGDKFDVLGKEQPLTGGFKRFRVGEYADKVRYVFDAEGQVLPSYSVTKVGEDVEVVWSKLEGLPVGEKKAPRKREDVSGLKVDALDFQVEGNESVFSITLSGAGTLLPAKMTENVLVFGVKDAYLIPSLRRYIDTSAFPTVVAQITPYVSDQDARFAVEFREPVEYDLQRTGNKIILRAPNGKWAFMEPGDIQVRKVPKLASGPVMDGEEIPPVVVLKGEDVSGSVPPVEQVEPMAEGSRKSALLKKEERAYVGEKVTLVFDKADVRNVLQLIAEVSDMNIIASDDVKGAVTLRLVDVPWDQALDVILDVNELGMVQEGNVIRILPSEKIRSMRESELSSLKAQEKLEPLQTEVFEISYTGLSNIAGPARELMSDRGKITEDSRNKQIIVSDVQQRLEDIRQLINILDTPEKQVLIEARIVEVTSGYTKDLGVSWGINHGDLTNNPETTVDIGAAGEFTIFPPSGAPATSPGGVIQFGTTFLDPWTIDLRISALETNNLAKIVSTPKVTTLNGEEAIIKQGTQIPYQSVSEEGTKTEFVDAALELKVTPVINPNNSIILEIEAKNDSPRVVEGADSLAIDNKEAKTKLIIQNGATTVIGGIYVTNESEGESGVPILMNLPILGELFKSSSKNYTKSELLIFITPRIIQ